MRSRAVMAKAVDSVEREKLGSLCAPFGNFWMEEGAPSGGGRRRGSLLRRAARRGGVGRIKALRRLQRKVTQRILPKKIIC